MPSVQIPAAQVGAAHDLPRVCARHGRDATRLMSVRFASRPRPWSYVFIPAGMLVFLIVLVVAGLALGVGSFGVLTVVADRRGATAAAVTFSLIAVLVLGLLLIVRSYTSAIVGAHVARGAEWVRLPRAHPRFVADLHVHPPGYVLPSR